MNDEVTIVSLVYNNWGLHITSQWFDFWVSNTVLIIGAVVSAAIIIRRKFFKKEEMFY